MKDKISHVFATLVATAIFTFAGINSAWAAPLFIGYYPDRQTRMVHCAEMPQKTQAHSMKW